MPIMTYDERLDAIRDYLVESDERAMGLNGTIEGHNCRLDTMLRDILVTEASVPDGEILKRSEFAVRSIAVVVLMSTLPGNRVISGILSQCAAEGILRHVQFPDFLDRLHKAVHEEEAMLVALVKEATEE